MKILDNIQKSIYDILSLLQNNMDIRKLVYYDTTDALAQPDITNSTLQNTSQYLRYSI